MATKFSDEFSRRLQTAEPEAGMPVIVTLRPGADVAELTRKGLEVNSVFENISAVAGTVTPRAARELAELEDVELVESDGEVHAL